MCVCVCVCVRVHVCLLSGLLVCQNKCRYTSQQLLFNLIINQKVNQSSRETFIKRHEAPERDTPLLSLSLSLSLYLSPSWHTHTQITTMRLKRTSDKIKCHVFIYVKVKRREEIRAIQNVTEFCVWLCECGCLCVFVCGAGLAFLSLPSLLLNLCTSPTENK